MNVCDSVCLSVLYIRNILIVWRWCIVNEYNVRDIDNLNKLIAGMTNEFIYNIRNLFSKEEGSILHSTRMKMFYIGPYQRSYKWLSEGKFDQVPQLLSDIYDAWHNSPESEYYLQYITVKADSANHWLEVIDGQQRLTTLSLLFYQLGHMKPNCNYNIALDKLNYSRYDNGNIFNKVCEYINTHDKISDKDFDEQDMYYMVAASKYIKGKLQDWNINGELEQIIEYLLYNVKIIVNIESNFVHSEDIFANLNDNHVPLTDAYLIKGLLITNAVSRVNAYGRNLEYTELQEKRKNLGRMWDEIQTWITHIEHSHFFFKHTRIGYNYSPKYSMEYFLELAFLYKYKEERNNVISDYSQNRLELFNKYNSAIKFTEETVSMIETIRHIYRKMVTVYEGLQYNLWGYMQFSKSIGSDDTLDLYSFLDMSDRTLKSYLIKQSLKRIPNLNDEKIKKNNYETLRYKSRNDKLTNLLLSYSVFLPFMESKSFRFRFYDYERAKWSFEHISPQNPRGLISIPNYAKLYVIKEVKKLLSSHTIVAEEKDKLEKVIQDIQNNEKIDANYIEFLFDSNVDEHSLGNMALLTREDNSANNNNPFMVKKLIIQNRKGNGAFIPNHTYEVFNKIIVSPSTEKPFSAELFIWNQQDVDAHIEWMIEINKNIINWLNKEA